MPVQRPKAISYLGHQYQIEDLIKVVRTGGKPLVAGREGRKSVEIVTAIYKSAAGEAAFMIILILVH